MAGPWMNAIYCDQGWTSQFLTKIQNLDGFGLLLAWRDGMLGPGARYPMAVMLQPA